ncbi:MAG: transglutaminaseTgpA domain-containing protein [Firmicutes bacterium]|nr:transglutaminaseTgpA domain-containing protein [Bacillota bacterium]
MKRESWRTAGIAAALGFLISFGAVGSVISGFGLTIADYPGVLLICGLSAVFCAAAFRFPRGGWAVLAALALSGGYLWRQDEAAEQLCQLVQRISHVYDNAYGWGALQLVDRPWDAGIADIPMAVLGGLISLAVSWSVCRRKSAVLPVAAALLALTPCLVVTDTVPEAGYLFTLLLGLVLVLLTARVRARNPAQGNRLTAMALPPAFLALLTLFLLVPKEGYVNRAEATREAILSRLRDVQTQAETTARNPISVSGEPENVDLARLGRRIESPVVVMEVTPEISGTLYLRGQDYDGYDGTGWVSSQGRTEDFSLEGEDYGDVTIRTAKPSQTLYLPYYPARSMNLTGGKMENTWQHTEYVIPRAGLPDDWRARAIAAGPVDSHPKDAYLELPETTFSRAQALLEGVLGDADSVVEQAEAIGQFVKNAARYDLNPDRMDDGETDFALWFLESAERGYCVHFATAATVLLRAAGIQARYVSGYLVKTRAGQTAAVTGKNAHAWAEYYEPTLGVWLILEATPSDTNAAREPQTLPEAAAPTQPEATQTSAETAADAPAESTAAPTVSASEPEAPAEPLPTESASPERRGLPAAVPIAVLAVLLILLQRPARVHLRRRRQQAPSANARALALWQEAELVSRLLKQPPPEELEALAQKAKFSQHTLTAEELSRFRTYLTGARAQLQSAPWYRRLIYRYLYAVI